MRSIISGRGRGRGRGGRRGRCRGGRMLPPTDPEELRLYEIYRANNNAAAAKHRAATREKLQELSDLKEKYEQLEKYVKELEMKLASVEHKKGQILQTLLTHDCVSSMEHRQHLYSAFSTSMSAAASNALQTLNRHSAPDSIDHAYHPVNQHYVLPMEQNLNKNVGQPYMPQIDHNLLEGDATSFFAPQHHLAQQHSIQSCVGAMAHSESVNKAPTSHGSSQDDRPLDFELSNFPQKELDYLRSIVDKSGTGFTPLFVTETLTPMLNDLSI